MSAPKVYKFGAGAGKRRAAQSAKNPFQNASSRNGERVTGAQGPSGGPFGKPDMGTNAKSERSLARVNSATQGLYGGLVGGALATVATGKDVRADRKKIATNQKKITENNTAVRRARKESVGKAVRMPNRAFKITDKGTRAERDSKRANGPYPLLNKPALAAGAGVGAGLAFGAQSVERGANKEKLKRQQGTLKRQEKKLAEFGKSAFGVDHG